jgi:hypothetical protein
MLILSRRWERPAWRAVFGRHSGMSTGPRTLEGKRSAQNLSNRRSKLAPD